MDSTSKFTQEISAYDFPEGFNVPEFECYDGTTDPDDHLRVFKAKMSLYALPDPAYCHLFISTLTADAVGWFSALPPQSISTFSQLEKRFLTKFMFKRRYPRNYVEMHHLKQNPNEPLKEFVERFNERILDVGERMEESLIISAFILGIQWGPLFDDLVANLPTTVEELMVRANNFRCAQEAIANRMSSELQRRSFRGRTRKARRLV